MEIRLLDELRRIIATAPDAHQRQRYLSLCDAIEELDCQHVTRVDVPVGLTVDVLDTLQAIRDHLPPNELGARRVRSVQIADALLTFARTLE